MVAPLSKKQRQQEERTVLTMLAGVHVRDIRRACPIAGSSDRAGCRSGSLSSSYIETHTPTRSPRSFWQQKQSIQQSINAAPLPVTAVYICEYSTAPSARGSSLCEHEQCGRGLRCVLTMSASCLSVTIWSWLIWRVSASAS